MDGFLKEEASQRCIPHTQDNRPLRQPYLNTLKTKNQTLHLILQKNSRNDNLDSPPHIEEHTSQPLSIKEDKLKLSKAEEDKWETPKTEEYKAESSNSKDDKAKPSNIEKDKPKPASIAESSPNIRGDKPQYPPSTEETRYILNITEDKIDSYHNTEENEQNTEQDKVDFVYNYKDEFQANIDRPKSENPPSNGETKPETLFSNPEEDKPGSLSITSKGQIMSQQLSTGGNELETQPNPPQKKITQNYPSLQKIDQSFRQKFDNTSQMLYPILEKISINQIHPTLKEINQRYPMLEKMNQSQPTLKKIKQSHLTLKNKNQGYPILRRIH